MQVIQNPLIPPACCIFCPGSVRNQYIDTEISFEFYGAILVCDQCVGNMGAMLGMASVETNAVKNNKINHLEVENYELMKQVVVLRSAVNTYLKELVDVPSVDSNVLADSSVHRDIPLGDSYTDRESQGRESSLGVGERAAPEQDSNYELDRVRSDEPKSFTLDLD